MEPTTFDTHPVHLHLSTRPLTPDAHPASPRLPLDAEAWAHRMHYGQRRDFHDALYWLTTVRDVIRFLRGERAYFLPGYVPSRAIEYDRNDVVLALLEANRNEPHPLWTLLLMIAFEDALLAARGRLAPWNEREDDGLVLSAFQSATASVSFNDEPHVILRRVRDGLASRVGLSVKLRFTERGLRNARRAISRRAARDWPEVTKFHPPFRQREPRTPKVARERTLRKRRDRKLLAQRAAVQCRRGGAP